MNSLKKNDKLHRHFLHYFPKADSFESLVLIPENSGLPDRTNPNHTEALIKLMKCFMDYSSIEPYEHETNKLNFKSGSFAKKASQ